MAQTNKEYATYKLNWEGIEIEARYAPESWKVIAHLEIETIDPPRCPLPVTETGYRSHFHEMGTIERDFNGDVVAAVTDWLNTEAKNKKWQQHLAETRQGNLFS